MYYSDYIQNIFLYMFKATLIVVAVLIVLLYIYRTGKKKSPKIQFCDLFAMATLIFLASVRLNVGSDYQRYHDLARMYATSIDSVTDLLSANTLRAYNYQIGFPVISILADKLFDNEYAVFFIVACIIYIPTICFFRKHSSDTYIAILAYLLLGFWGSSMNILKQAIAMMMLLYVFEALQERRTLKAVLLSLVAVSFHTSAIIAIIAILFFNLLKPTKKTLAICLIGGVLLRFIYVLLLSVLSHFSIFGKYINRYIVGSQIVGVDRTFMIYGIFIQTAILGLILFLAISNIDALRKVQPDIDSYISVTMIGIPLCILGISNSMWLIYRFGLFFIQFVVIIIPALVSSYEEKHSEKTTTVAFAISHKYRLMLIFLLLAWHFLYSVLMLDNNTFSIDTWLL